MKRGLWVEAYKQMVTLAVLEALDVMGEGDEFSIQEFAEHFGLKQTHNLRRRLEELVYEGTLARRIGYKANGRQAWLYSRPTTQVLPWDETEAREVPVDDLSF